MADFEIDRNYSTTLTFTVDNLPVGGLSAGSLSFVVWRDREDSAALFSKTNADFTITDVGSTTVDGVCSLTFDPADTASLPDWSIRLYYDLVFAISGGDTPRISTGTLTVVP